MVMRVVFTVALLTWVSGCATVPATHPLDSIDAVAADVAGKLQAPSSLAAYRGRVVLLDVCASSVAACALNARLLDDVVTALDGRVVALTLLLDDNEEGAAALSMYGRALDLHHPVLLLGPRARAGQSALGNPQGVPRLVIIDADGRVRFDEGGGIISIEGLVSRLRPLL